MGLLETEPVIVVDQINFWLANDFAIRNIEGAQVGRIDTFGGTASRIFAGPRKLSVIDSDDSTFVHIDDSMNLGMDNYDIYEPSGNLLAILKNRISFFSTKLSVEMSDGNKLSVSGNFMSREFVLLAPDGRPLAQLSRSYRELAATLLGKNRYVIAFNPEATIAERRVTIAAAVAIDLILRKKRRSNN